MRYYSFNLLKIVTKLSFNTSCLSSRCPLTCLSSASVDGTHTILYSGDDTAHTHASETSSAHVQYDFVRLSLTDVYMSMFKMDVNYTLRTIRYLEVTNCSTKYIFHGEYIQNAEREN